MYIYIYVYITYSKTIQIIYYSLLFCWYFPFKMCLSTGFLGKINCICSSLDNSSLVTLTQWQKSETAANLPLPLPSLYPPLPSLPPPGTVLMLCHFYNMLGRIWKLNIWKLILFVGATLETLWSIYLSVKSKIHYYILSIMYFGFISLKIMDKFVFLFFQNLMISL